jgi:hypothetical protein
MFSEHFDSLLRHRQKDAYAICLALLIALSGSGCAASHAGDPTPNAIDAVAARSSSMSDEKTMRDLFDRWERVWHQGQYDLIPSCVAPTYIRHDPKGDRSVTCEEYAAEIVKVHEARPGIRVVVYDHSFQGDRAWFRFAFKWKDPKTVTNRVPAGVGESRKGEAILNS